MPEDIQILRDVTVDGVRHITAVPSALVCSRQIDFDLVDGTIRNLRYTAGCHGNLQALGALLIILSLHPGIEMWCNGSTRDFGSLS